jgi:hypothetical protein
MFHVHIPSILHGVLGGGSSLWPYIGDYLCKLICIIGKMIVVTMYLCNHEDI